MKIKMRIFCSVFCLIAIMLGMAAISSAEPVKLTYSCFFPPSHVQSILAEQWSREVEKRTAGAVKIEYFQDRP